jgi:hypothetical protein
MAYLQSSGSDFFSGKNISSILWSNYSAISNANCKEGSCFALSTAFTTCLEPPLFFEQEFVVNNIALRVIL